MATVIALGGLALGAYEYFQGQSEKKAAQKKIDKLNEDKVPYDVPTSIQSQVEILRRRSQQGLPGEEQIAGQIKQQTAQGVAASRESATSAADLLGATTNLYGKQTEALTELQIASARQKAQNEMNYAQGLGTLGQYEDKAFTQNEAIPYQQQMNQLMGIQQSSYDMMTGGLSTAFQSGATLLNQYNKQQQPTQTQQQPNLFQYTQPAGWQDQSLTYGEQQGTPINLNTNQNNWYNY